MPNKDLVSYLKEAASATGVKVDGIQDTKKYAKSLSVRDESSLMVRQSQSYNMDSNISTPPGFYSPFLTQSAFQVPNNRKEVYQWAAYWYDTDPKVSSGINFYTDFIFSGFKLECESSYVKEYFEHLCKKLNFSKWLPVISFEYHLRGDVFAFLSVDCKKCRGENVTETGEKCNHEGATWKSITLIDPGSIEIAPGFIDQQANYYFTPTDELKRIVQTGNPPHQYENIPDSLKSLILANQPIYLDPESITHFKRASSPWAPYGTSIVKSLFKTLMLKDKLRNAQNTIAERLIYPIKIVKVGTDARPANEEDLQNVQEQLAARALDPLLTIVTHNAFELEWKQPDALTQTASQDEHIDKELYDGLMLSSEIISGLGGAIQSGGTAGMLALDRRLERLRLEVAEWMEEKIFKPEAIRNGFTMTNSHGSEETIYPKIKWNDLKLRDETSRLQTLQALRQSGDLSAETLLESLGLNYDQEVERLRFEQSSNLNAGMGGGMEMGGGMGAGFGGGMEMGGGGLDMGGGMPPEGPGGIAGGLAGGGGGMPPPGGAEGGAPGGATPPPNPMPQAMPTMANKLDNYKKVSGLIYKVVTAQQKGLPTKFKSEAHEMFTKLHGPVSGRGRLGTLDKDFKIEQSIVIHPDDGGPTVAPLNRLAQAQLGGFRGTKTRTVTAAKKSKKKDDENMAPRLFTKLEQSLYSIIMSLNLPLPLYAQFIAGPSYEYALDAAVPAIKLGIEADSETFHSNPEQIRRDKYRDSVLATDGWTILRFTDREIKDKPDQIAGVIHSVASQLMGNIGNSL